MEISLAPAYVPLIQKPSCCAVTCLQMILFRNGFGLHDQEDLALEFGVKIDKNFAPAFRDSMPIAQNVADFGISTVESQDHINAFLNKIAPSLKATSFRASAIPSLKDFLIKHISANHDVWVEYHTEEIHAYDRDVCGNIHDNLIERLDPDNNTATLIDPWPGYKQRHPEPLTILERAISKTFGRETGFIIIETTHPAR